VADRVESAAGGISISANGGWKERERLF